LPGLPEDIRGRSTDVGIVVGQRRVPALREHQGRADLEHRVRGDVEEELRRRPCGCGRRDYRSLLTSSVMRATEARKPRAASGWLRARSRSLKLSIAGSLPITAIFKVRDRDGDVYILRNDGASGQWEVTFFRARNVSDDLQSGRDERRRLRRGVVLSGECERNHPRPIRAERCA
jgi:hypothetical protein